MSGGHGGHDSHGGGGGGDHGGGGGVKFSVGAVVGGVTCLAAVLVLGAYKLLYPEEQPHRISFEGPDGQAEMLPEFSAGDTVVTLKGFEPSTSILMPACTLGGRLMTITSVIVNPETGEARQGPAIMYQRPNQPRAYLIDQAANYECGEQWREFRVMRAPMPAEDHPVPEGWVHQVVVKIRDKLPKN